MKSMASPAGFEPATSSLEGLRKTSRNSPRSHTFAVCAPTEIIQENQPVRTPLHPDKAPFSDGSEFTPGPWAVFDARGDDAECPGIEALDGKLSIVVFGEKLTDQEVCGIQGRTVEEAQANARLIAAAPDLLEALNDARAAIWSGGDTVSAIATIDAALAKALSPRSARHG